MLPKRLILFDMIAEELGKLTHKGVDILELSVYGCKTNVSNLVDLLELVHNELADFGGADFGLKRVVEGCFNFTYCRFYITHCNGTLFASANHTVYKLGAVKYLAGFILFDYNDWENFESLVGCESLLAGKTLATATDSTALLSGTGIKHLAFGK